MTGGLERILSRYGQAVRVNGAAARAFFQPVREKGRAAPFAVTPLGRMDDRRWTYLGKAEVKPGDLVEFQGRAYAVDNCEGLRLGDETVCWRAVLTVRREAAE